MRLLEFFRLRRLDREFDEELASHVALLTEETIRRGMSPEEAHRSCRAFAYARRPHRT